MAHRSPPDHPWLTARPIAHRGLHDAALGIVENTLAAARGAIASDFAIECDVRRSSDGEVVVFHDAGLVRLTGSNGTVETLAFTTIRSLPLLGSASAVPSFSELLATVAGRVPLVCEIKSAFDGDMRLADTVAQISTCYPGPLAIKSFDPAIISHLRGKEIALPLGIVAQACFGGPEWQHLTAARRHALAHFLDYQHTTPDFVSYRADDLPHAVPHLCRRALGLPILAWTVRSPRDAAAARQHCDQVVFEDFCPRAGPMEVIAAPVTEATPLRIAPPRDNA